MDVHLALEIGAGKPQRAGIQGALHGHMPGFVLDVHVHGTGQGQGTGRRARGGAQVLQGVGDPHIGGPQPVAVDVHERNPPRPRGS